MSLSYAQDAAEALKRFAKYKQLDPFPSIPPSLLNRADIADYVAATAMICPFDESKLKSGSYAARIYGNCYCWDQDTEQQIVVELKEETDRFELKPNSLVYVQVEPTFRLPDYIAMRFNLKISYVHRGILLGTGPLIDPGFEGKLLIPLHNFSNNSYILKGKEDLIWIEFTKLSPAIHYDGEQKIRKLPEEDLEVRKGVFISFPEEKKNKGPDYYFDEAAESSLKAKPVFFSSVRGIYRETNSKIRKFDARISSLKKAGWGAGIAIAVAIAAMLVPTWSLINDTYNTQDKKWQKLLGESNAQREDLRTLKAKIDSQQSEIKTLRAKIKKLVVMPLAHKRKIHRSADQLTPKPLAK